MTMQAAATIEYATNTSVISPQLLQSARRLLMLAILSGLCVAVCFSPLMFGRLGGGILHVLVFTATVGVAVRAGISLQAVTAEPLSSGRNLADGFALIGLSLFGLAPLLMTEDFDHQSSFPGYMTAVFGCLTMTSWRHVPLYRLLANHCRAGGLLHMARAMLTLGWFKALYETAWLGCCLAMAAAVFIRQLTRSSEDYVIIPAFGALFGCVGFGGVWLWMIIAHALLLNRLTQASLTTRAEPAFAVVAAEALPVASPALPTDCHVEVLDH